MAGLDQVKGHHQLHRRIWRVSAMRARHSPTVAPITVQSGACGGEWQPNPVASPVDRSRQVSSEYRLHGSKAGMGDQAERSIRSCSTIQSGSRTRSERRGRGAPLRSKATFHLYEASTSATGGKTHTGEFTPTEAASASCDEQPSPSRSRRLRGCVARCSRRALPGYGPHVTPCLPSQHLRDGSHPCKCWAASESGAPMRSVPHSICGLTPQRVIAKNSSLCTLYPMPQSRIQRLVGPGISLCLDPTFRGFLCNSIAIHC